MDKPVVVIGAGVGGLVSALLLAARGLPVCLLESHPVVGGKMRQVVPPIAEASQQSPVAPEAGIDAGPTVFTMRWVLEEVFAAAGTSLEQELELAPLDLLARHSWGQDENLDLFSDPQRSADAIASFSSPRQAAKFLQFCKQARRLLQTLNDPYMGAQRPSLFSLTRALGPRGLAVLTALGPFTSLWRALSRHFDDPRLHQLFGRYATYCGSSPFRAPATMMLIAQVEMDGVWSVKGGMVAVAQALARRATALGVDIRCSSTVQAIELQQGAVHAVRLANGQVIPAAAVVFNGESHALATGLLGPQVLSASAKVPHTRRSLSAMTWAMHAPTSGFALARHNVFFDTDYASEFRDIFEHRRLPRQATVYVCAQDRPVVEGTPTIQAERLLCLVNAPAYGDAPPPGPGEISSCEQAMFKLLQRCGLQIHSQAQQIIRTTPHQFHQMFPASGGALYGQATHSWMGVFQRPAASTRIPGLFLAGGGVHPGAGVPMAAISGQLAAAALMAHLDSTSRSRTVATFGGTSTPSAMTDSTA